MLDTSLSAGQLLTRTAGRVFSDLDVFPDKKLSVNELNAYAAVMGVPSTRVFVRQWDKEPADFHLNEEEFTAAFNHEVAVLQADDPWWRLKVTCCVAVTVGVSVAVLLALLPRLLISRNLKWLLAGAGGVAAVATYTSLLSVLNTLTSLLLQAPLALSVSMLLAGLWVWLRRRCLPSHVGSKAPAATTPARQVGLPATPPHRTPQHLAHPDMVAQSPSPGAEHAGGGGEDEAQDVDLTGEARLSPGGGTGAPAQPSSVPPTPSQPQPQGQEPSSPPQTEFEALLAMGNVSVHDIQQSGGRRPRSPAREAPPSPGGKVVMAPFTPFPRQGAWGSSDAPASSGVSTIYPPTAARLPPSPGDTPLTRSRHEWSPEPSRAIQWTDLTTSGTFGPGASTDGATGYSGVSASALRGSARRRRRR